MTLHFIVNGFDLVEDVCGELDVEMVRHHGQYEPVPELEEARELLQATGGQAGGPASHQLRPQSPAEDRSNP